MASNQKNGQKTGDGSVFPFHQAFRAVSACGITLHRWENRTVPKYLRLSIVSNHTITNDIASSADGYSFDFACQELFCADSNHIILLSTIPV
jgi:hypothetical protein